MKSGKTCWKKRFSRDIKKYWKAYLLVLPVVIYFILFKFNPLYGILIAFKDYRPTRGIWESSWTDHYGFKYFLDFLNTYYFWRLLGNTLRISLSCLLFGWPAPIILALLLNELKSEKFKRITQTVSYLPHFISTVIICGMINLFVSKNGFITQFLNLFGYPEQSLLSDPNLFVPIYVISNIWAGCGWGTIIYLAALSGIDGELYDAARIDGANRWKQTLHVTLPGISGTMIIMLLLRMGSIMTLGHEKIMLLYNPGTYKTADVISTYVYRSGILNNQYSYSTAIGIFNNVINFIVVMIFNKISKKVTDIGIW